MRAEDVLFPAHRGPKEQMVAPRCCGNQEMCYAQGDDNDMCNNHDWFLASINYDSFHRLMSC